MIRLGEFFKKKKIIIGVASLIIIGTIGALFLTTSISITSPYKELDKLPQEYPVESALKDGNVVSVGDKVYNIEKLEKFIETSNDKKSGMVRITTYTIEAGAMIYDLMSNANGITLIQDVTRDRYSGSGKKSNIEYKIATIIKQNENGSLLYIAKTDKGKEIQLLNFQK